MHFIEEKNVWISIRILLKFGPKCPIDNIPALVQIMTWRQSGDRSLWKPMMVRLLTHICVTWPQWVNAHVTSLWCCQCSNVGSYDIGSYGLGPLFTKRTFVLPQDPVKFRSREFGFRLFQSLWNLTGTSPAALQMWLLDFRAMWLS